MQAANFFRQALRMTMVMVIRHATGPVLAPLDKPGCLDFLIAMIAETAAVVAVMIAALLEMTIPEASDTHPAALLMLLRALSPCKAGSRGREAAASQSMQGTQRRKQSSAAADPQSNCGATPSAACGRAPRASREKHNRRGRDSRLQGRRRVRRLLPRTRRCRQSSRLLAQSFPVWNLRGRLDTDRLSSH